MAEKLSFLEQISKKCSFQKSLALNIPYEYKGVTFYPVSLEHLIEFYICVEILMIKQERTKDKKLMKLPYLWFLAYAFENNEKYNYLDSGMYIPLLYSLIEICTRQKDIDIKIERNENGDYKRCLLCVGGIEFNYKDFTEIRRIILTQSGIEYSDEFLNSDTERAIYDGRAYNQRKSGYIPPNLEDLMDILSMYLHKSLDEIVKTFTIRKFNRAVKYMSSFEEWKLLRGSELTGMVTFKQPIHHWIEGIEKENIF